MKSIWDKVELPGITVENRLVRSATWEGIAKKDGSVSGEAFEIYRELAKGGIGLIITGFTSVSSDDYYFGGMMRLSDDALIPQYAELVELIHSYDVPVMTQLALGAYYKKSPGGRFIQIEPDEMS